jgi:hypothetical protein
MLETIAGTLAVLQLTESIADIPPSSFIQAKHARDYRQRAAGPMWSINGIRLAQGPS